jgi:hypothetical protein
LCQRGCDLNVFPNNIKGFIFVSFVSCVTSPYTLDFIGKKICVICVSKERDLTDTKECQSVSLLTIEIRLE